LLQGLAEGGSALSFALEMAMAPRVGLEVSPALVAFSEMLILPCAAMQAVVENELCANGALERLDAGDCPICRGTWRARCPVCSVPTGGGTVNRFADVAARVASEPEIHALLRAVRMEIGAADAPIAECLVDSLDEHGLLDRSCAEIAAQLGVAEPVVARVLDVIRSCGPPGVGATSIPECLLLQLDALDLDDVCTRLARAVITDHLPALASGHFTSIARALGVSRAQIKQVLDLIRRRLRPYPAFTGNVPARPCYVVPDVVVREHDEIAGAFTVELVEAALTRLGIRQGPRHKAGSPSPPNAAEDSVPRAKAFLAQLHDRWETLRRVAEYTVQRQQEFLVDGATALKPLTRAEVAAALDLHESTVSRAVADKYALLPDRTIVPLSRFFGVSGGVDGELRKLLESADGPMSDQRLADRLREAGYPIARRTVAKHRARLGFTAAPLR
jgi:RNA polymerase sigma-54 factor